MSVKRTSEAYISDITRPVKKNLPQYWEMVRIMLLRKRKKYLHLVAERSIFHVFI